MKTVFQARSAAVAAAVILIAGCSSMQSHMAQTQMSGIMCDKCQTVWFPKIPVDGDRARLWLGKGPVLSEDNRGAMPQ